MIYLRLFWEFFKTGLFSIGGGLASLPFLKDVAVKTGWFTLEQLSDMIAVAESTPGPIGVNVATFAGFVTAGAGGAVLATIAFILPGFIATAIVATFLARWRQSRIMEGALSGLRPASLGLIAAALVMLIRLSIVDVDFFNWKALVIAAAVFVLIRKFKGHPVIYILGSAILGIVFNLGGA